MKHCLLTIIAIMTLVSNCIAQNAVGVNVIFIGNSITYGGTLKNPATDAPPAVVKELLYRHMTMGHVETINMGVCGTTSVDWAPDTHTYFDTLTMKADEFARDETPLIFCISLGTNDSATRGTNGAPVSNDTYAKNLTAIIDALINRYPMANIIVNHPIWYSLNTYNTAEYLADGQKRLKDYRQVINNVVTTFRKNDKNRVFIGDTEGWDIFRDNETLFTPERGKAGIFYLHPNKDGARVLASLWEKTIYNVWRHEAPEEIDLKSGAKLLLYRAQGKKQQKAVIVCPGGGYEFLAKEHEGTRIAHWLSSNGITAAVLLYRMPGGDSQIVLTDATEAMQAMRQNAADWGGYKDVGIMGSSAGGHFASTASTHLRGIDRPDFQILLYPVISMQKDITHMGSHNNLLGKAADETQIKKFSNELCVDKHTPPAFIYLSSDDNVVPAENSMRYAQALLKNGVSTTLHVYPTGGHGWGFSDGFFYKEQWRSELLRWFEGLQ